jgi:hypothetical protein
MANFCYTSAGLSLFFFPLSRKRERIKDSCESWTLKPIRKHGSTHIVQI